MTSFARIVFPTLRRGNYVGHFLIEEEMNSRGLDLGLICHRVHYQVCFRHAGELHHLSGMSRRNEGGVFFVLDPSAISVETPVGYLLITSCDREVFYPLSQRAEWIQATRDRWYQALLDHRESVLRSWQPLDETREAWARWHGSSALYHPLPASYLRRFQPERTDLLPTDGVSALYHLESDSFKREFLSQYQYRDWGTTLEGLGFEVDVSPTSVTFSGASKERLLTFLTDPKVSRLLRSGK